MAIWLLLALAVGLSAWARALSRRGGWRRHLRFVPFVCGAAWLGVLLTVYLLVDTFDRTRRPGVDASLKARDLAEGISRSMLSTAIGLGVLVAVLLLLTVAQLVGNDGAAEDERKID